MEARRLINELEAGDDSFIMECANRIKNEMQKLDLETQQDLLVKCWGMQNKGKKERIKKDVDFLGANLKGINLQGENLRGKLMIASNLRDSYLRKADFIGADLRDADLSGADLTDALFLTQSQINSAIGDIHTKIPIYLEKPSHW